MSKNIVVVIASCQFNVIDVIVVCVCSKNASSSEISSPDQNSLILVIVTQQQ